MLEGFWTLENLVALVTLAGLEIVLGIDNIVFVVVVTNKLPAATRDTARRLGIALAMITRIALLLAISAIMGLTAPLFTAWGYTVSRITSYNVCYTKLLRVWPTLNRL